MSMSTNHKKMDNPPVTKAHQHAPAAFRGTPKSGLRLMSDLVSRCGIEIDGCHPYDLHIHNDAFYTHALARGLVGVLDAYVDGWWDCDRLDDLTARVLAIGVLPPDSTRPAMFVKDLWARLVNLQTRCSRRHVSGHYDLDDDLFAAMLGARMIYSCAYWKDACDLDRAQENKLELICNKADIHAGQHVLDIGCGWGGFAEYAARTHGASVTGITNCPKQYELARGRVAGLDVDIRLADYRDLTGTGFDAVVSVGMFEHVGYKNYRRFMTIVRHCLKPDGLFLLHTIGGKTSEVTINPWLDNNIFPNAMLPSARQITTAAQGLFVMEDWHNFGADYDKTLMAWFTNFDAAWPRLRSRYDERFYRFWKCYLLTCAGSFRARKNQLWQIVLSPRGVSGGYTPVR